LTKTRSFFVPSSLSLRAIMVILRVVVVVSSCPSWLFLRLFVVVSHLRGSFVVSWWLPTEPMAIETVVSTVPALAATLAERATGLARAAVSEGRSFAIALPGGSVARAFFPTLATAPIDWRCVDWFWGDERGLPPQDPESNYRLADQLLFKNVSIDPTRVHRMPADADDLDTAAATYEVELRKVLGAPPRFEMILLGVGADGHVCALFPKHAALTETSRLVVPVTDSPKPPQRRLTLTLPALAHASLIVIAAFGREKAPVIDEALNSARSDLPLARAARLGCETLFLLDAQAAGRS
jgi:6-phosphogluconolactonase